MSRQTVKDITINSPSGDTSTSRDIGAEAQCIEVSRDALGNIVEDIDATGVIVDSVQPLSETLKDIEDSKQNILTFDSVPTSGSSNSVTSGGIHSFTTGGQVALNNSQPVTGGEVFNKLNNAIKGDSVSTKVAKTGTSSSVTGTIAAGTSLDNVVGTLLNNDTTLNTVVSKTANGLAPKLPNETTTTKYLRQDGTWQVPPDNNTTYSNGTGLNLSGTTFSVKYGTSAGTACQGNDSRLSNSRTPTSHASTGTGYGAGNASNYGHVKVSDNYTSSAGNASQSVAASSKAVNDVYTTFFNALGSVYLKRTGNMNNRKLNICCSNGSNEQLFFLIGMVANSNDVTMKSFIIFKPTSSIYQNTIKGDETLATYSVSTHTISYKPSSDYMHFIIISDTDFTINLT